MPFTTRQSITGFIATTPEMSRTDAGDPRLYTRIGQEHYIRHQDGSFSQDETTFHDMVMFGRAALIAADKFAPGDRFVAQGYTNVYQTTNDQGEPVEREQFIARHLGHDAAVTRYQVERGPRVQDGPTNTTGTTPVTAQAGQAVGL